VNIVGVGSTVMGDDGVGPVAIERLRARGVPEGVRLHEAGLAVSDVLSTLDPAARLIVVDAVRAGGPAGTLYRFRLDPLAFGAADAAGMRRSLHELSVGPALHLEALAGRLFADVTVFGVEPAVVAWADKLSPAVARAVGRLVDAILDHIDARCACTLAGDRSV